MAGLWDYLMGTGDAPAQADVATTPPVVPTYDDARSGYRLASILNGLHQGLFSGLAAAVGPDTSGPAYNQVLDAAQKTELGRLGLPQASLISGIFSGKIDPSTGQPYSGTPAQQPPQDQPDATPAQAYAPSGGMALGGASQPGLMPYTANGGAPPAAVAAAPQGGGVVPRLLGIPTPAGISPMSAFVASRLAPDLFKEFTKSQFETRRGGSTGVGPDGQPQYNPIGEAGVSVPPGAPGFRSEFQQNLADKAAAPAAQSRFTDAYQNFLKTGVMPDLSQLTSLGSNAPSAGGPVAPPPTGGSATQPLDAPAPYTAGNNAAQEAALGRTRRAMIRPDATAPTTDQTDAVNGADAQLGTRGGAPVPPQFSATPQQAAATGKDMMTDRGTIVPSPFNDQTLKTNELDRTTQAKNSGATTEKWDSVRGQIDTTRARVLSTANILTQTQSGGLNEVKATVSKWLSGVPALAPLANSVMSAKDRSGVQSILWNSMQESLAYLKTANAGTGGRILNSEFNAFLEHGYSPDMEPSMLRQGMTQLLGGSYQTGNMIDDWHGPGERMNWLDANQFQSAYLRKNPIEGFINYANQELPTFKGETTAQPLPALNARVAGKTTYSADGITYTWDGKGWRK